MKTGPFDSLRDYIHALESNDRLIRIKQMDQDKYEATGFAYRLVKEYGYDLAPAFLIEKIKINNQWLNGPIIGNLFGGWDAEALIYGVNDLGASQSISRKKTFNHLKSLNLDNKGWPKLPPVTVDKKNAPCKENIVIDKDVDILKFPWLQTNPADALSLIHISEPTRPY